MWIRSTTTREEGGNGKKKIQNNLQSVHFSSVHLVISDSLWPHGLQHARLSCPSLTPGVTQTHVHWVGDVIQPSHLLSTPSPPTFNLSQHQGLFQWISPSHQVARVLSYNFSISPYNEYSGLISFRMDWLDLLAVQGTLKVFSNTTAQKHQFFGAQLSLESNSHIHTQLLETPLLCQGRPLLARKCLCFLICCLGWS